MAKKQSEVGYKFKDLERLDGKEYDYLGHFREKKWQKLGHNFDSAGLLKAISSGAASLAKGFGSLASKSSAETKVDVPTENQDTPPVGGSSESSPRVPKELPKVLSVNAGMPKTGRRK